jgi:hypothetical protein
MTLEMEAKAEVLAAMEKWIEAVTSGGSDAPDRAVALYAPEAVLWATFSPHIRATPEDIRDYFVHFTALPNLKATVTDPKIRIYGDMAVNSGGYTFTHDKGGQPASVPARYSFTYVKKGGHWMIVDHHSSVVPESIG